MKFEDLTFYLTHSPQGIQARVKFGDLELSVIKNEMSYGQESGLYEIGVFDIALNELISLPGISEPGDTVKGYLSESEVTGIMTKLMTITKDTNPKDLGALV